MEGRNFRSQCLRTLAQPTWRQGPCLFRPLRPPFRHGFAKVAEAWRGRARRAAVCGEIREAAVIPNVLQESGVVSGNVTVAGSRTMAEVSLPKAEHHSAAQTVAVCCCRCSGYIFTGSCTVLVRGTHIHAPTSCAYVGLPESSTSSRVQQYYVTRAPSPRILSTAERLTHTSMSCFGVRALCICMRLAILVRHNPPSASVAAGGCITFYVHAYGIVSALFLLHHPHVRQQMRCDEIKTLRLSSLDGSRQEEHSQLARVAR
ncbi:hypothetical protein FIBSPDRAFT_136831 [Athelia psychrophila]|uniref:Uncharacterized protein n=1 Tax=Athelia psychrophila TaxID=1759441 RepID=A0A166C4D6_9AGAM|nr:hypothetical protein FIBSPDRAFT_136831 [Fibularhizoctonia sp. CBS 109695]